MITKIKNAVFVSDKEETGKYLYYENGIITAFTEENLPFDAEIDAKGMYVSSGFIDIHTHGAGGYDFADGSEDDIKKAAYTHALHGTTTVFPTCSSSSFSDMNKFVENTKNVMKKNAPGKPHIAGSHLEGPYFADSQKGAQNPDYIKNPVPEEYMQFVKTGEGTLRRMSFAPELQGSMELCEYLKKQGIVASFGHTDGIYEEIKPIIDKGCTLATHLYSGMNTVTRRGLYRKLGAVETAFLEDSVDVEIIADGTHLPKELLKLIYKAKGPDKIALITDSMRGAGAKKGPSVLGPKNDGVECIVGDDVAYLPDMKAFAGSIATADRLVRVMNKEAEIPLCECIKMITKTPARIMGIQNRGQLKQGFFADLVFFDENINIKKIIIEGKELK